MRDGAAPRMLLFLLSNRAPKLDLHRFCTRTACRCVAHIRPSKPSCQLVHGRHRADAWYSVNHSDGGPAAIMLEREHVSVNSVVPRRPGMAHMVGRYLRHPLAPLPPPLVGPLAQRAGQASTAARSCPSPLDLPAIFAPVVLIPCPFTGSGCGAPSLFGLNTAPALCGRPLSALITPEAGPLRARSAAFAKLSHAHHGGLLRDPSLALSPPPLDSLFPIRKISSGRTCSAAPLTRFVACSGKRYAVTGLAFAAP
jgi:hypothetical protein